MNIFKRQTRAERNERNYQKWLKTYIPETTAQRIELTRVFTDRNDNNFYILKNPAYLTRERAQRIEESLLAIDFGVGKAEITEKMTEILKQVDDMPWQNMTRDRLKEFHTNAKNSINDLLFRLKNISIDDKILEAAMYFFYIDGENPYIINSETIARKFEAVRNDDELRAFFLNSMEQILKGLNGTNA
jgi:hypothetical protein